MVDYAFNVALLLGVTLSLTAGTPVSPTPPVAVTRVATDYGTPTNWTTEQRVLPSPAQALSTRGSQETAASTSRTSHPTMMNKLRDVKDENASSDEDNDAAEELDAEATDTSQARTTDDNDADEHDDYEDKGDDYVDSLPLIMRKKEESKVALRERGHPQRETGRGTGGEYYEGGWPEVLPTPAAQTDGDTKGYQRDDETYVVEDSDGYPCVLAYFKSKITVYYSVDGKDGKDDFKSLVTSPPRDALVSGKCDREEQVATLELTWTAGTFLIGFAYDTLTDSWYVSNFQFAYNTGKDIFVDSNTDQEVLVKSEADRRFWTTSHARSFRCMLLHDISLESDENRFSGTVHFDEVRVQALTYGDRFKTPKHCLHRVHRDESVPLIVGSTLAGLTVLTIGIYAAMRYFKIKKVQYDTMQ